MKKTRFTEAKIVSILHQQEAGKSVRDILIKLNYEPTINFNIFLCYRANETTILL